MAALLPYIDLLWIPLALLVLHKEQKIGGAAFAALCALLLRLQVEVMESVGHDHGVFGLLHSHVLPRGQIVYAVFIVLFFILSFTSPGTHRYIFIAAAISMLLVAFCAATVFFVL